MSPIERAVLIVDDSPEDIELYRRYLKQDREFRYTILTAELGREGLTLWQRHQLDIVLLDYQLPDLDGLEFLAALQTQSSQAHLPVIVVTGQGNEKIAVRSIKAGAQDYLVKGQITAESLQVAVNGTIETVQLSDRLQHRIERERVIAQITQKVYQSLNLDEILSIVVEEVRQFLRTDRVVVFQWESDGKGVVKAESVGSEWVSILSEQIDDPCFVESYIEKYRQGMVTARADVCDGNVDPCHVQLLTRYQVRANLVVPILHEDRFWGVSIAHHCAAPRQWQPLEIDLLQQLSTQVSVAIRQAELYRQAQYELAERKQAEEALRESEERLQLGIQVAGVALAKFDYASNRVELTPEAAALYGLPPDELIVARDRIHETFHPDERAALEQIIERALDPAGSGWFAHHHRVVWPNGEVRWLSVRKQVFFDRSNRNPRPNYAILAAIDITDQKQSEIQRDRILELKQAALAESERVNRIKDEFLAVLSHELRSPLNPILGWTKMLQTRKLSEAKVAEALATIERNAKAQCQLVDDLLDMARVLRGKMTLNAVPVNLLRAVESAIETVQTAATAKSISICPVLVDIGQVSGDAVRLQQIVWNLLSNAVKFTPHGGRIDIRLEQIERQAQITVTDTGEGINPNFLPHIFESFRQEDASVSRKHGGLGLGLAIVYQLVEAHGGTISARSLGEGQGATFTVRLPLSTEAPLRNSPIDPIDRKGNLVGIRVLIIDDEPDSLELAAEVLAQAGAEVRTTGVAAEFLSTLVSFRPDIAISDIGMPDVDGYTLLRMIRSLPPEKGGRVPAIALTAYAGEKNRQKAIAADFQKHVSKPIEPNQLVAEVIDLLNAEAKDRCQQGEFAKAMKH
ncbi:response regulator [Altericista sp. CCNU0014]|uniref:response regulator n=1 Tax=Altericista sp. CCNU0014 TaxID=3082949 RepID=UPI003850CD73